MSSHILTRFALLVPLATFALYACASDDTTPAGGEHEEQVAAVLGGDVTDETYTSFIAAFEQGTEDDATRAATLDEPADGAMLPSATPARFSWHIGPTSSAPSARSFKLAALRLSPATVPAAPSWTAPLRDLLGERAALAHGDPFNGTATYLRFSAAGSDPLLEVLTSITSYTPDDASWAKLTGAGGPITLKLFTAQMEEDRVLSGGGPFNGSVVTFTVIP